MFIILELNITQGLVSRFVDVTLSQSLTNLTWMYLLHFQIILATQTF